MNWDRLPLDVEFFGAKRQRQAVMSLSRMYRQQGRPTEARPLLAETYGWFTEGCETRDLQEAKALLEAVV